MFYEENLPLGGEDIIGDALNAVETAGGAPEKAQGTPEETLAQVREDFAQPAPVAPALPNEEPVFFEEGAKETKRPRKEKQEKEEAPQVYRVGTLTLGFALIVSGIFLFMSLFNGPASLESIDYMLIARFSPVLIIMLGLEIIIGHVRAKGGKIKYDLFSGFICLCIAACSLMASFMPYALEYYGPEREQAGRVMNSLFEEQVVTALAGEEIFDVSAYFFFRGSAYPANPTLEDLQAQDSAYIGLDIPYCETKEEFADEALRLINLLQEETSVPVGVIALQSLYADGRSFYVNIDRPFAFKLTAENIAQRTVSTNDNYYYTNAPEELSDIDWYGVNTMRVEHEDGTWTMFVYDSGELVDVILGGEQTYTEG